jgi:toxin ParE1/3/4
MIRKIRRTKQARRDLIAIYNYIYPQNPSAADRVFDAIETTIRGLSWFPGTGTAWESDEPELQGLRYTPVSGYRNYLVFFRVAGRFVEIFRIVHGAQDLRKLIG